MPLAVIPITSASGVIPAQSSAGLVGHDQIREADVAFPGHRGRHGDRGGRQAGLLGSRRRLTRGRGARAGTHGPVRGPAEPAVPVTETAPEGADVCVVRGRLLDHASGRDAGAELSFRKQSARQGLAAPVTSWATSDASGPSPSPSFLVAATCGSASRCAATWRTCSRRACRPGSPRSTPERFGWCRAIGNKSCGGPRGLWAQQRVRKGQVIHRRSPGWAGGGIRDSQWRADCLGRQPPDGPVAQRRPSYFLQGHRAASRTWSSRVRMDTGDRSDPAAAAGKPVVPTFY